MGHGREGRRGERLLFVSGWTRHVECSFEPSGLPMFLVSFFVTKPPLNGGGFKTVQPSTPPCAGCSDSQDSKLAHPHAWV